MSNGVGTAGFLEGLVGGALLGQDVRHKRDDRRTAATDRTRKLALEDEELAYIRQQRALAEQARLRTEAMENFKLAQEYGVAYNPDAVTGLRRGVGAGLMGVGLNDAGDLDPSNMRAPGLPPGFEQIPGMQTARDRVGARVTQAFGLDMAPGVAADLYEGDLLDDYLERTTPGGGLTATVTKGGASVHNVPLDDVDRVLNGLPSGPAPSRAASRDTIINQISSGFRSETSDFRDAAMGMEAVRGAYDELQNGNPAASIAMLFGYAKVLDPGSVAREGEIATLQRVGAYDDRVKNWLEMAQSGRMTADVAKGIMDAAEATSQRRASMFRDLRARALNRAELQGLERSDLEAILPDYYQANTFSTDNPHARGN